MNDIRLNILYTAYSGLGKGGAEVSMSLLARALAQKHNIIIASTEDYKWFKTSQFKKIKVVPILAYQNNYMKEFFKKIIKEEHIDIVHSHDARTAIPAILAAQESNRPVITHYRDYWFCCPKSSLLKTDLTNCETCNTHELQSCSSAGRYFWDRHKMNYIKNVPKVLKKANVKIAISEAINNKLKMIGIDDAIVLRNPIDTKLFNVPSKENGYIDIGYIGSLDYHKGVQILMMAMREILPKYENVRFVLVGDGPLKESVYDILYNYKDRVLILNSLPYEQIAEAYSTLSMVIIPSIWQEPFSRVAIEAMAAGKPIIASKVGGLQFLIKDDFGILIPPKDTAELQKAIELLIENKERRITMGEKALEESKKYDSTVIAEEVNKIYQELY